MDEKKNAQTPKETEQSLDRLGDRLEEMDKAEGVFGEPMIEDLPDEYMEEIGGGFVRPTPPERPTYLQYATIKDRDPN